MGDQRSNFFGTRYPPGSARDLIIEAHAGPHDWFRNLTGAYTPEGYARHVTGIAAGVDHFMNAALLLPSAPFGVAGLVHPTSYWALSSGRRGGN